MSSILMGQTRQMILNEVALKHGVTMDEILGKSRAPEKSAARIEIAERLRLAGFRRSQISRILNRDLKTIQYYLNGVTRPSRHDKRALPRVVQRLPVDVQKVIVEIARLGDTTPATIIAEWVSERAQYEFEARHRSVGQDFVTPCKSENRIGVAA